MAILGLHHVNVGVTDLDVTRSFYLALGLVEIPRPGRSGAWFAAGSSGQIHVSLETKVRPHERRHFALEVDDLDATVATLEAAGVVVEHLAPSPGAGRQALVHDPDYNLIELRHG